MAVRWSADEDRRLREWYRSGVPLKVASERLGRSEDALVARRRTLGLAVRRPPRVWSERLDALLRASAEAGLPARVVAERLGLPTESVRRRRRTLVPPRSAPRRYRSDEDEAIRAGVACGAPFADLAVALGRSSTAIRMRAQSLGLVQAPKRQRWTQEEDRMIRAGYASGLTCAAIGAQLLYPRSASSVSGRARKLGLATYARRWAPADDAKLRALRDGGTSLEDASELLGRTPEAVRQRARKLAMDAPPRRARWNDGRRWSEAEEAFLRRSAGANPNALALTLGRSDLAIRRRMADLKVEEGRHRSPHHAPPSGHALTPGEAGVVARELERSTGRRLLAVARRLERSPGELQTLALMQARAPEREGVFT